MEKQIGPKPIAYLFLAIGAALMGAMLLGFTVFSGIWALLGAIQPIAPTAQNIGYCAALALAVTFIVWVGLIFLGQTFCALILQYRSWMATTEAPIGTTYQSRRYAHWLPFATTPWSRFWLAVHSPSWRAALAILAIVLVPALSAFVPLAQNPAPVIVVAVVMLAVAVVCARWEASHRSTVRQTAVVTDAKRAASRARYLKGLEYRNRKRQLTRARLKDAALAATGTDGLAPTAFDRWVEVEVEEGLRADPLGVIAFRGGDLSALDDPTRVVFDSLEARVPLERVRELVLARATRKRRSRRAS